MSLRRIATGATVVLLALFFWYTPIGSAHAADAGAAESGFIAKINGLRASHGLSHLSSDSQLTGVARNWAQKMANAGKISHNPGLGSQVTSNWAVLGENVGVGGDVNSLFNAFVASPEHYANLTNPNWSLIGVGVVFDSHGTMYTTHDFEQTRGSYAQKQATPKAPAAPSQPKSSTPVKPKSNTTTTQAPAAPPPEAVAPPAPVDTPRMPERTMHSLNELYDLMG